ncbi:hypothetical protein BH23CHL1_BH23CHL1_17360 [soil metagenome]|jgi:hypothetical protein
MGRAAGIGETTAAYGVNEAGLDVLRRQADTYASEASTVCSLLAAAIERDPGQGVAGRTLL